VPDPGYGAYSGAAAPRSAGAGQADTADSADDTSPLPVVLAADPSAPEPIDEGQIWPPVREQTSAESAPSPWFTAPQPAPAPSQEPDRTPGGAGHSDDLANPGHTAAAEAKLEQIKDLYLTAEAIGDEALGKHFEELSQRQRSLIREYFGHLGIHPPGASAVPGDDRTQGGASLPD
jgi:hypothetical protein